VEVVAAVAAAADLPNLATDAVKWATFPATALKVIPVM